MGHCQRSNVNASVILSIAKDLFCGSRDPSPSSRLRMTVSPFYFLVFFAFPVFAVVSVFIVLDVSVAVPVGIAEVEVELVPLVLIVLIVLIVPMLPLADVSVAIGLVVPVVRLVAMPVSGAAVSVV